MRRVHLFVLLALLSVCLRLHTAYAGNTAGVFQLPFDPQQTWQACGDIGYKEPPTQYFMQLNTDFNPPQYHTAEDWNGQCGASSDLGAPLFALADGVVQYIDPTTAANKIGKILIIRYTLPDGTQRDGVYYHIQSIYVRQGDGVSKGQHVATIGDGNGSYPNQAHLHWEMRRDLGMSTHQDPYYKPLRVQDALKYAPPSLFVDDRKHAFTQSLSQGAWTYISWYLNAPSSTAFLDYRGEKYSLQKAADMGLVYRYVYEQRSGAWYYYPNLADVFFGSGNTYAVWSFVNGAVLSILVPGDRYRADRARVDMVRAASANPRFTDVVTQTYDESLTWAPNWELRALGFGYTNASGARVDTSWNQATLKSNPLVRYVSYYDPDTHQWTNWGLVNPNTLD